MNENNANQKIKEILIMISIASLFFWVGFIMTIISYAADIVNRESLLLAIGPVLLLIGLIALTFLIIFSFVKKHLTKENMKLLFLILLPLSLLWLIITNLKKEKNLSDND